MNTADRNKQGKERNFRQTLMDIREDDDGSAPQPQTPTRDPEDVYIRLSVTQKDTQYGDHYDSLEREEIDSTGGGFYLGSGEYNSFVDSDEDDSLLESDEERGKSRYRDDGDSFVASDDADLGWSLYDEEDDDFIASDAESLESVDSQYSDLWEPQSEQAANLASIPIVPELTDDSGDDTE